jgi:hypothetical protein
MTLPWEGPHWKNKGDSVFETAVNGNIPPRHLGMLYIISARTTDNPNCLPIVSYMGCHSIYLEKPGAPTVGELEGMQEP